jgi:hypothetical protein
MTTLFDKRQTAKQRIIFFIKIGKYQKSVSAETSVKNDEFEKSGQHFIWRLPRQNSLKITGFKLNSKNLNLKEKVERKKNMQIKSLKIPKKPKLLYGSLQCRLYPSLKKLKSKRKIKWVELFCNNVDTNFDSERRRQLNFFMGASRNLQFWFGVPLV